MLKFTKDSFVTDLVAGKLLIPHLVQYDRYDRPMTFEYTPKEHDDAWHPSGDCLPSAADLYARVAEKQEREKHSPSLQKAFLVGHFWHQVLQDVIVDMGFAKPEAIECKGSRVWGKKLELDHRDERYSIAYGEPYHWACGSGDVAPLELPNWTGILDIKTMRKGDFDMCKKSGLLPERFAEKYEAQINVYMDFFNMDHGMILGVNKDSPHDFLEFVFERNDDLVSTIYTKWEYVSLCLDAGEEPDPSMEDDLVLSFTGPVAQ